MNLKYVVVDSGNLDLAVKIQNTIFPLENGRKNYIEGITNDPYRKEMINYIVYANENPIGVVGLYAYNEYPKDAWLSWFGVLQEYRQKGYGSKMFDFFASLALAKGYTAIRVYTDDEFDKASLLYEKKKMIKEFYQNVLESDEINKGTIIYSKSLIDGETSKWHNKFLGLTAQSAKEKGCDNMNYDNINIRKAKKSDIKQIATIKVEGWRQAYGDIIANDYLENMSVSKEMTKYANNYYSLDTVFVAEQDNEILGFCRIYDYNNSPYKDIEIDCEIREIYVRPNIKRMGIGSKIFKYVLNYLKNKGKKKLYLGVFESNYKSRKFYEKMGGIIGEKSILKIENNTYTIVSYTYELK